MAYKKGNKFDVNVKMRGLTLLLVIELISLPCYCQGWFSITTELILLTPKFSITDPRGYLVADYSARTKADGPQAINSLGFVF
jgi:hypothetical protein